MLEEQLEAARKASQEKRSRLRLEAQEAVIDALCESTLLKNDAALEEAAMKANRSVSFAREVLSKIRKGLGWQAS